MADGLDTVATVWLNGREVARTDNMFVGGRWEVRSLLRPFKTFCPDSLIFVLPESNRIFSTMFNRS